jgi:hypothetical protein
VINLAYGGAENKQKSISASARAASLLTEYDLQGRKVLIYNTYILRDAG